MSLLPMSSAPKEGRRGEGGVNEGVWGGQEVLGPFVGFGRLALQRSTAGFAAVLQWGDERGVRACVGLEHVCTCVGQGERGHIHVTAWDMHAGPGHACDTRVAAWVTHAATAPTPNSASIPCHPHFPFSTPVSLFFPLLPPKFHSISPTRDPKCKNNHFLILHNGFFPLFL